MGTTNLQDKWIGFIGCGKISSAVCRGFATASGISRPARIIVSRQSESKSALLKKSFPDILEISESNEEIAEVADIVFIGLLPSIAREVLPELKFKPDTLVISMMAAVDYEELLCLIRLPPHQIVKSVPLPSVARHSGPILYYPCNESVQSLFEIIGCPVCCNTEAEMKPLISITGHISVFYELMNRSQRWVDGKGVNSHASRQFIASFYSSLSDGAMASSHSFQELCEEAATPGGLNEQSLSKLRRSDHFELVESSLEDIFKRLTNC